jgi:intraflagellar transport protein 74
MEALKHQITYAIEQMTLQGVNLKASNVGKLEFNGKHDLSSQDGLLKEYKKLGIQLKQLQLLEKRTREQLLTMQEEQRELLNDIQRFRNLNVSKTFKDKCIFSIIQTRNYSHFATKPLQKLRS